MILVGSRDHLGGVPSNDPTPDHDRDALECRLDAVERALTDDEPLERAGRLDDLGTRVASLIRIGEGADLRLSLVPVDSEAVVRVERASGD